MRPSSSAITNGTPPHSIPMRCIMTRSLASTGATMTPRSDLTTTNWQPYCGALYPLWRVAGKSIVCTRPVHDPNTEKHRNSETGFSWWQYTAEPQGGSDDSQDQW